MYTCIFNIVDEPYFPIHNGPICVYVCVYTYTCIDVYMYIQYCRRTMISNPSSTYMCVCVCVCIYIHAYMYTCTFNIVNGPYFPIHHPPICVYVCVCVYTCIYVHIYIQYCRQTMFSIHHPPICVYVCLCMCIYV